MENKFIKINVSIIYEVFVGRCLAPGSQIRHDWTKLCGGYFVVYKISVLMMNDKDGSYLDNQLLMRQIKRSYIL